MPGTADGGLPAASSGEIGPPTAVVRDSAGNIVYDPYAARVIEELKSGSGGAFHEPPGEPFGPVDIKVTDGSIDYAEVTSYGSASDEAQFVRLQTAQNAGYRVAFYAADWDEAFAALATRYGIPIIPITFETT